MDFFQASPTCYLTAALSSDMGTFPIIISSIHLQFLSFSASAQLYSKIQAMCNELSTGIHFYSVWGQIEFVDIAKQKHKLTALQTLANGLDNETKPV